MRSLRDTGDPCQHAPEVSIMRTCSTELPRGFGVRWLVGNGADTALEGRRRAEAKAVCALTPRPPHSKTLARGPGLALVQGRTAR
jgi:hypothetical protein